MPKRLWLIALVSLYLLSPAAALAGGDIYVGGPYGTKITSLPYEINTPGVYYLAGDLAYAGNDYDGITVNADNVTLDLMGFTLAYTGTGTTGSGIYMQGRKNVEIRNGTVRGWLVGVQEIGNLVAEVHRAINIRAEGNYFGIHLNGQGHLIQGCTASSSVSGAVGLIIQGGTGTISGCVVKDCEYIGIFGHGPTMISGNVVVGNGALNGCGIILWGGLVMGNEVSNCERGIVIAAPGSVIGNTVNNAASNQTGFSVFAFDPSTTLLDQNTVTGPGTHYSDTSGAQWRNNGG